MITEIFKLIELCLRELELRNYSSDFRMRADKQWLLMAQWMASHSIFAFTEDMARAYCMATLGSYLADKNWPRAKKLSLRLIRMLASFQQTGDLEQRVPAVEHVLSGPLAEHCIQFLDHLRCETNQSDSTIKAKRYYLWRLCEFFKEKGKKPSDLTFDDFETFLESDVVQHGSLSFYSQTVRQFLHFLFTSGLIPKDLSQKIPVISRNDANKLPTTYTAEEVARLLGAVERSSAIGKRDYLILLLASQYGLRASDITTLSINDFDWDRNVITHKIKKTGAQLELPLLSSVGNAVYDYLKDGRPKTECPFLIVSHDPHSNGAPIKPGTLNGIVVRYMGAANIKDWQKKRHGPHSLRHSLAVSLLRGETSVPVIGEILGHRSSAATSVYLKLDVQDLRKCPLPMPALDSPHYDKEGGHGKV